MRHGNQRATNNSEYYLLYSLRALYARHLTLGNYLAGQSKLRTASQGESSYMYQIRHWLLTGKGGWNTTIWPNSIALRDIKLRNPSDNGFDLIRLLKIKCYGAVGLHKYDFPSVRYGLTLCDKVQAFKIWVVLALTFQDNSKSNLMVPLDSPNIISY